MTGEYCKQKRFGWGFRWKVYRLGGYLLIHDAGVVVDTRRKIFAQTEMIFCRGLAVDGILEVHRIDASFAAVAIANEQELRESWMLLVKGLSLGSSLMTHHR